MRRALRRRLRRGGAGLDEVLRRARTAAVPDDDVVPAATSRPAIAEPMWPRPRNPRAIMRISLVWTGMTSRGRSEELGVAASCDACGGCGRRAGARPVGVAVAEGRDDETVLVVHRSARTLEHEGGVHAAVGLRAIPEPVHQVAQHHGLGARVAGEVELAVEGEELLGIVDGPSARRGPRGGRGRPRPDLGAHAQQQRLEALAHPVDLLALGQAQRRDPGAACSRRA